MVFYGEKTVPEKTVPKKVRGKKGRFLTVGLKRVKIFFKKNGVKVLNVTVKRFFNPRTFTVLNVFYR